MSRVWIIFLLLLAIEILIFGYLLNALYAIFRKAPPERRAARFRQAATNHELYLALLKGKKDAFASILAPVDDQTFADVRKIAIIFVMIIVFDVIYDLIHAFYGL
ncbi:hypothetical protein [Salinisphaera sp. Q1T1-3]|uniref:hypothetical protein n=1 Tax=Salinisphaera sp. Q1T1-3 TaxID=2321229 RepID=UPI000E72BB5F|nr:hypothetical protein [Salinisphaera sp. Q1T1-3]RJS91941.1 hypothetical protein D3260_13405 [Salinisphaera sp. Q1T1-3]